MTCERKVRDLPPGRLCFEPQGDQQVNQQLPGTWSASKLDRLIYFLLPLINVPVAAKCT